jgi:hypothetical protein
MEMIACEKTYKQIYVYQEELVAAQRSQEL